MANTRLSMRKIKTVLRLKYAGGLTDRQIAESCGIARSTVADYLRRAQTAGLSWPLPEGLGEADLEAKLFPASPVFIARPRPQPDCRHIYEELRDHRNVNLTLAQLWLEYKEQHPDGYQYTQFCDIYRRWRRTLDYCLRQEHKAGEKVFVDYTKGLFLVDPRTGERIPTHLFVAVWGASNHTYAEASLTQTLPCWIGAHVRALTYFDCAPRVFVPDNLKSGVTDPCFFEPDVNPTYADFTEHYGTVVLPARPRKPRDKAKVEAGVLVAQRWILAVLRHRTFHTLADLNAAIAALLERLNTRPLRRQKESRRQLFERLDRPAALRLPTHPYEYAEWKKATVNIDYHVEVDGHYYSVPFRLLRETLDVRLTAATVELFHRGERVAAHVRSFVKHTHTTLPDHMPPEHRRYREWSPSRLIHWAGQTGPATAKMVERILASRTYPEQGYRACLGLLRLGKLYGPPRLEAACVRALAFNACSFKSVRSILSRGLDRQSTTAAATASLPFHDNVRGGDYYH